MSHVPTTLGQRVWLRNLSRTAFGGVFTHWNYTLDDRFPTGINVSTILQVGGYFDDMHSMCSRGDMITITDTRCITKYGVGALRFINQYTDASGDHVSLEQSI